MGGEEAKVNMNIAVDDETKEADKVEKPLIDVKEQNKRKRGRSAAVKCADNTNKAEEEDTNGRGTPLKDIPNVAYNLSRRKEEDTFKLLHTILFGRRGKAAEIKSNISRFSGFAWHGNEEKQKSKVKKKLDKCVKEKLWEFCDILDIPIAKTTTNKEDTGAKLLDFLMAPHATTTELLAEKEQPSKGKKRVWDGSPSRSKGTSSKGRSTKSGRENSINKPLALVGETSKQMLSLKNNDCESSNAHVITRHLKEYDDALEVLERLVANGLLEGGSPVWCDAVTELFKENKRRIFMKIKVDTYRVSWLQFESSRRA